MSGRIVATLPVGAIVFKLTKMLKCAAQSFHAVRSAGPDVQLRFYTLKGGIVCVCGWSSSVVLVFFLFCLKPRE